MMEILILSTFITIDRHLLLWDDECTCPLEVYVLPEW